MRKEEDGKKTVADLSQNMKGMLKDKIRKIGLDKISKGLNL